MLSPRGAGATLGICGAFDFSEEFLVKIPTVGSQNLVKLNQISSGVPSVYIENELWEVVFLYKYKNKCLPLLKTAVFKGFAKALKAAPLQFHDGRHNSFVNGWCHFCDTWTINKFFSAKLKIKGNYVNNHSVSNSEPLLPNIPFIPIRHQVDPPIFRKI